jgi:hypothetical protein
MTSPDVRRLYPDFGKFKRHLFDVKDVPTPYRIKS